MARVYTRECHENKTRVTGLPMVAIIFFAVAMLDADHLIPALNSNDEAVISLAAEIGQSFLSDNKFLANFSSQ